MAGVTHVKTMMHIKNFTGLGEMANWFKTLISVDIVNMYLGVMTEMWKNITDKNTGSSAKRDSKYIQKKKEATT